MEEPGPRRRRGPAQEIGQGGKIVDPDEQVHFRELFRQLRPIALHQAAGHHQAHLRPPCLDPGQLQDGVHRLLAGRLDEAAGIDQQQIGGGGRTRHLPARPGEPPQHDFRVHQVLGAAQGDGVDRFGRFSVFGFPCIQNVSCTVGATRWIALDLVLKLDLETARIYGRQAPPASCSGCARQHHFSAHCSLLTAH